MKNFYWHVKHETGDPEDLLGIAMGTLEAEDIDSAIDVVERYLKTIRPELDSIKAVANHLVRVTLRPAEGKTNSVWKPGKKKRLVLIDVRPDEPKTKPEKEGAHAPGAAASP
jgi:hypothetical protein